MNKIKIFISKIKNLAIEKIGYLLMLTQKINIKEKISFLEQFSTLLNSGIPITNSLTIISYQTKNKKLKKMLETIHSDINKWVSLSQSFWKYSHTFKQFDISIIEMWEMTWKLGDAMEEIKNKEEKAKEIRSKVLWAFIYPIVIIILSIWMIIVFILYVIPKITDMYKDAKVNLPKLTKFVIDLSDYMQKNISSILMIMVLIFLWIYIFKTNKKTKIYYDRIILSLPIAWNLIRKSILANFTSSLWTLLKNGVIINRSLEISSWVTNNDYYKKEIEKMVVGISVWEEFSKLLWIEEIQSKKENALFPIELASIVKIWEQTWKLAELLIKISHKYNKEIDNLVKNLSTAIEPLVIIFVWWVVWTLIMAIMLPFFNMVNVI